jgi:probable phosphoglycerate mutase
MQGRKDSRLTSKGVDSAIALGKRLHTVELNCIYASSSGRTMHTAQLIRGDREIPVIPTDELMEINLGDWEGKTADEISKLDSAMQKAFWESPQLYQSRTGESFYQVRDRAEAILKKIVDENASGNVLIVSHAVVVKTILSIYKDIPVEQVWEPPFMHGTSLSIVELDGGGSRILLEGDMGHTKASNAW